MSPYLKPSTAPWITSLLFVILISLGALISIPLGPVPFVLSDFFILLGALLLGPKFAGLSIGTYLLIGGLGLPVFTDGKSGWDHFAGPTGGYLIGFLFAGIVVGYISHLGKTGSRGTFLTGRFPIWKDLLAVLAGYGLIYLLGVTWLKYATGMDWEAAISAGCLTFIVPMMIKSSSAVLIAQVSRRLFSYYAQGKQSYS